MFSKILNKVKETTDNTISNMADMANNIADNIPNNLLEKANEAKENFKNNLSSNIENISDKYIDSGLEGIESYCSWCFTKSKTILKEKNDFTRNVYTCTNCGNEVIKCRACNNKAKYSNQKIDNSNTNVSFWSNNFCSVHEGTISKFETLDLKLDSISEYKCIVEREDRNYKKIGTTAAFTIGGAAVIAPLAFLAAPAIGGALGSGFFSLSGAAATNAGLATLGGGALAAGGAGMAGGIAVVTATGSALGGRYGAVISNSYFGDIDGFDIVKIKSGKGIPVICIDGFLTQDEKESSNQWVEALKEKYSENTIYHVRWESKRLRDLANLFTLQLSSTGVKSLVYNFAKSASKQAATKANPLFILIQSMGVFNNPWSVASLKAYQTGILLADIIARTEKEYILVGHSLGSRVIYSCLDTLSTKEKTFIKDVYLLGGAVDNNSMKWEKIHERVSGKIYNFHSSNDLVLKYLYSSAEKIKLEEGKAIGRHEIDNKEIKNIDVTEYILGHTKYKEKLKDIINFS